MKVGCDVPRPLDSPGSRPGKPITLRNKVIAYIVRGDSLVVFVHDNDTNPILESGLQVPAGTVHEGEELAAAVPRKAFEKAGLIGLRIVRNLGRDEIRWPGTPPWSFSTPGPTASTTPTLSAPNTVGTRACNRTARA